MRKIAFAALMLVVMLFSASGASAAPGTIEVTTDKAEYAIGEPVVITVTNTGKEAEAIYEGSAAIVDLETGEYVFFFRGWCGTPIGYLGAGQTIVWEWDQTIDVVYFTTDGWYEDPDNGQQAPTGLYEVRYLDGSAVFSIGEGDYPGNSDGHMSNQGKAHGQGVYHWANPHALPEFYLDVIVGQDTYAQEERVDYDIHYLDYANIGMLTITYYITEYGTGQRVDTPSLGMRQIRCGFDAPAEPYDAIRSWYWDPYYTDGTPVEPGHYEVHIELSYSLYTSDFGVISNSGTASDDFYIV